MEPFKALMLWQRFGNGSLTGEYFANNIVGSPWVWELDGLVARLGKGIGLGTVVL